MIISQRLVFSMLIAFFASFPAISMSANFTVSTPAELQNALNSSAGNGQDDSIHIKQGTYLLSTALTYASAENFSLTLLGSGKEITVLDGNNLTRIITFSTTQRMGAVTVRNLSFQRGSSSLNGGALNIETESGTIRLDNCEVIDSAVKSGTGVGGGAALNSNSGIVRVISCEFLRNSSAGNVGGLFASTETGSCSIINCTFEENSVTNSGSSSYFGDGGGAMFYSGGTSSGIITGNSFSKNSASGGDNPDGGGLMTYQLGSGSTLNLEGNIFSENSAGLNGGACMLRFNANSCTATVSSNAFHNNTATTADGAGAFVYMDDGSLTYTDNSHSGNIAAIDGGGAWINCLQGNAVISGNTFYSNQAGRNGAGLSATPDTADLTITKNVFASNRATGVGGGLSYATSNGSSTINNNTWYDNSAGEGGGGAYFYFDDASAQTTLYNNIFRADTPNALDYSSATGSNTLSMTYSNAQGGASLAWFGAGCIDADPLFADTSQKDFRLTWSNEPISDATKSPCIDTGDPASPLDPDGSRADMGALTFNRSSSITKIYFPHIDCRSPWQTEICAINKQAETVSGTWYFYDSSGSQVAVRDATLAGHARDAINVNSQIEPNTAITHAVLEHTGSDLCGYTKFYQASAEKKFRTAVPAVIIQPNDTLFVPHIECNLPWWTGLAFVNTSATSKNLTISICNQSASASITIAPGEHWANTIRNIFADQPALNPADFTSATISGCSEVIGLLLFGQSDEMGGLSLSGATQNSLVIPENTPDSDSWWTGLAVFNPGAEAITYNLSGYLASGNAVFSDQVNSLAGCGKNVILLSQGDQSYSGADWYLLSDASGGATAFELVGTVDHTQLSGFSCIGSGQTSGVFPKIEQSGWTGFGLVNPGTDQAAVTINAYSDGGVVIASTSRTIPAKGKLEETDSTLFEGSDIGGATYVGFNSDQAIFGYQLNSSPAQQMLDGLPAM